MSYILDALKKADSERKLGSVPNVYMDPLPMARSEQLPSPLRKAWLWIAAALLAIAGIAFLWFEDAQPTVVPVVSPALPPIAAVPSSVSAPVSEESVKAASVKSEAAPAGTAAAQKAQNVPAARAQKSPATAANPEKPVAPVKPAPEGKKQQLAQSGARATSEKRLEENGQVAALRPEAQALERAVEDVPVAALRDLPDHVRRSMPPISIGGYIYSAKPAERSMLLNNRLVREGEQVASGLTLEKMMAKEAILNYQGQRFRMPYQGYQ